MQGGPNEGPSGLMSLNGWGSTDSSQNVSGTAASAAETGSRDARDRAEVRSQFTGSGPALPPGVTPQTALDFRAAAINAGAGQRVNPGFFDSRTRLSPAERALAKEYRNRRNAKGELVNRFAKKAYRKTGQGGIMGFLRSGGIFGNLLRGVGQKFGLGKKWDEPTYDMSQYSDLGLYSPSDNPEYYSDLGNENILNTTGTVKSIAPLAVNNNVTYADQTANSLAIPKVYSPENEFVDWKRDGGRIGYNRGRVVNPGGYQGDEFEDENTLEFMQDQGIPYGEMAETSPFEMRIQELMDEGMSWQEAYQIASEEFGQMAEGPEESFNQEGTASIV